MVALPQSVLPALCAVCWAVPTGCFHLLSAALAVVGVAAAHLCANLLDDYFDYRNAGIESRERLQRAGMRARIGKANYLAEGRATLEETLRAACCFGVVALAAGLYVFFHWQTSPSMRGGWPVVLLAGAGGLLAYFYSAKPLMLCYRGLGELTTGLIFGPLLMAGMAYASCGMVPTAIWPLSVAVGLLVVNILYTHSIMDADPDHSVGKTTLATLLATSRRMLAASFCFCFLPYVCVACSVPVGGWGVLATVVTLPAAVGLYRLMVSYTSTEGILPEEQPRWWMGPMPNWEAIEAAGIGWFMLRWYLARNLLGGFVVLLALAAFL